MPRPERFACQVSPHVASMSACVRQMLLQAERRGDLRAGEIIAPDIVDRALLRAYAQFPRRDAEGTLTWLNRLAAQQLNREVRRLRREG